MTNGKSTLLALHLPYRGDGVEKEFDKLLENIRICDANIICGDFNASRKKPNENYNFMCDLVCNDGYVNLWEFGAKNRLAQIVDYSGEKILASYEEQEAKIERYDKRIEEIAEQTKYHDKVKKLECFLGIKTHTALSLIVETGDFERFAKGNQYASYLGLAPGENSSSDSIHRLGITKAGNSHLRQLLIEASGGICKGAVGHKSKDLRARQNGNTAEVIAYADKANTRLRSRYYKFIRHGKKRNVAVAAIARELACFVWGMMTDNIEMKAV